MIVPQYTYTNAYEQKTNLKFKYAQIRGMQVIEKEAMKVDVDAIGVYTDVTAKFEKERNQKDLN